MWRVLQQAANRTGVDPRKAHPHAFRHACGRKWARIGTINEVAAMLGHRSIQATMMYTTLSCDVELSKKFLG
jgi:site-specific recombinase XerD